MGCINHDIILPTIIIMLHFATTAAAAAVIVIIIVGDCVTRRHGDIIMKLLLRLTLTLLLCIP
jgi:hypothetical protein